MARSPRTRYSRWDGTQHLDELTADELMQAMSEDLLRDGDLMNALRRLFWEGMERQDGDRVPGMRDLLQRLRQQRQQQLNKYDLGSVIDDIKEQLAEIVLTEQATLEQRLETTRNDQTGSAEDVGAGENDPDAMSPEERENLRKALESMVQKHLEDLADTPSDPAGAIRHLQQYDFMNQSARQKFDELVSGLQQQMMQQTFQGMQQSLAEMTPEQIAETRQMMQDLNEMLEAQARGEDPQFEHFMHKWGHMFGPDVKSLDDLMEHMRQQTAAMQQLMDSMSPEQREELQGMMQAIMQDPGLQQEMERLQQNLGQMMAPGDWREQRDFRGDESLTMSEAMRIMDNLERLDELEQDFRSVRDWNDFKDLDTDAIRELLGDDVTSQMEQLENLAKLLEDSGFATSNRRGMELTPRGVRKIGEKALTDIFAQLKRDRIGQHEMDRLGGAGERIDSSKPYEFGDPFLLDLEGTLMNAIQREGAGRPVRLDPSDFEVYRTEYSTRTSTVLMIDMSRSMFYSDSFTAAKRISLALDSLIRSKYPRDSLDLIGFSYHAEVLQQIDLPSLTWNEYQYGTNMQHGFQLARQLLAKHHGTNRQIIMITDGEPTAHIENGQVVFNWPPMPRTFQETLREVVRCTRDGIKINTFMLERSPYMIQFVNDLMRINGGRVFTASPEHLGEYILVDYVANKRKWLG